MPTKQPVPPPKFNIQDQVLYAGRQWKVTDREFKSDAWHYDLKVIEEIAGFITEVNTRETGLTLISRNKHNPKHAPQKTKPMPDPEPGYRLLSKDPPEDLQPGDEWWEHDEQRWRGVSNPYNLKQHKTTYYRRKVKASQESTTVVNEQELEGHYDEVDSKWLDEPNPFKDRETKTVVNEQGGKQSHLDARFDCIPPVVLRLLAQCLGFGARKYGDENWKNISQRDNLNHAMNHINEWNRGNRDEHHLVNAMARLTFALWQAVDSKDQPDTYTNNSSE